ncbi:heavy metal-associated isoprenylated plant protein 5-like isoform X2 [Mangifera indica]|uniref:heavy metal-associated isoprenylated plant protein 5-like isoform X2 n=1 Tax=Mangifera indica TaxID=29780 RepID=UPI001CF98156|nr:heavy metal-associated isoprenylated plant protein 5-like isoform X2 [Mangifera indica]
MNSSVYANELEQFVKQIDGVDKVKGDCNSVRLEVTGKVDPFKVKETVERETKKKVKLILPLAETEGDRDENKGTEAKLKKQTKRVHKNDIVNKKTEERVTVLKIKLCCDSCNQKLCKNLKTKGLDIVAINVDKDLVEVKGKVDLTELRSYIKTELNKDVEIVIPTEVKVPVKKGNGTTKKKENHAGDIDKKDKDAAPINKRNQGTAVSEKHQDTGTANEKIGSIAGINEKHIGSASINEPDKDKNGDVKNRKNRDSKAEMESKTSNAIGGKRYGDGGGNREENGSSIIKLNPGMYYTVDDDAYGYWRGAPSVRYSNDSLQMFSDENPHSCSII